MSKFAVQLSTGYKNFQRFLGIGFIKAKKKIGEPLKYAKNLPLIDMGGKKRVIPIAISEKIIKSKKTEDILNSVKIAFNMALPENIKKIIVAESEVSFPSKKILTVKEKEIETLSGYFFAKLRRTIARSGLQKIYRYDILQELQKGRIRERKLLLIFDRLISGAEIAALKGDLDGGLQKIADSIMEIFSKTVSGVVIGSFEKDIASGEHAIRFLEHARVGAEEGVAVTIPLLSEEKKAGMVYLYGKKGRKFEERDLALIKQLCLPITLIIKSTQLIRERNEENKRTQRILDEVTKTYEQFQSEHKRLQLVLGAWNLNPVTKLHQMAGEICQSDIVDACVIKLVDQKTGKIKTVVREGTFPSDYKGEAVLKEKSITVRTAHDRKIIIENDITSYPTSLKKMYESAAGFPLFLGGEVVGVVLILNKEKNAYTEENIKVLSNAYSDVAYLLRIVSSRVYQTVLKEYKQLIESQEKLKIEHQKTIDNERKVMMGTVAAIFIHEVRNKILVVSGLLEELLEDVSKKRMSKKKIREALNKVMGKMDDQIAFMNQSLVEFRKGGQKRRLSLEAIFKEMNEAIRVMCLRNGIKYAFRKRGGGAYILGIPSQLEGVFTNLVINAIEAMPKKGRLTITLKVDREKKNVQVYFTDTGMGMDEQTLEALKRGKDFFTTKEKGTGVGLTITRDVVKKHNGKIDIKSRKGEGATLIITLPLLENEQ